MRATARYSTRILKRKPTSQTGVAILKLMMMAQTMLKRPVMGLAIRKTPIEEALCRLTTGPPQRPEFESPRGCVRPGRDTLALPITPIHRSAIEIRRPQESSSLTQLTPSGRLTPPSQGRQYVLGAAILAFREPLAQLADDRAGHSVALEPSEQLLLASGELHTLQVPTHPGGQSLPQEIYGPSPPRGRSLASLYRGWRPVRGSMGRC
jgi:hypothetical protein